MSITTESLGVSIKVSQDLRASLNSSSGTRVDVDVDGNSNHQLVKLVPLFRRATQQTTPSSLASDVNETSDVVEDEEEAEDLDENHEDTEDPIIEASAPRSLEEMLQAEDDIDGQSEDELSYSPPPTLPVVVVNLERLCGYVPNTETELDAVVDQVKGALNEDEFDERVTELFEINMARHGDSSEIFHNINRTLSLDYPEFLCPPDGRVLTTARVWKQICRSHKIQVVKRILNHLKDCNRSLVWKSDMNDELCGLAKREDEARRESKLEKWRSEDRKVQLDKLYQVRETFHHRLEMTRIKLEELEDDRELQVRQQGRGLQALDLASNIFAFNEEIKSSDLLGLENQALEEEADRDEWCSDDTGDEADDDRSIEGCQRADNDNVDTSEDVQQTPHKQGHTASKKARRRRVGKKHREHLENAAQQALEKQKFEEALAEEERLFELFTSEELLMAQAAVQSLEVRMQQVDDLLESLQDEEWADEEDGFKPTVQTKDNDPGEELSLLDQILAMILGTLSPPGGFETTGQPDEEHFEFIRLEHKEILASWRKHFGRLPMSKNRQDEWEDSHVEVDSRQALPSSTLLRAELGITDNEDDWDKVDELESILTAGTQSGTSSVEKKENAAMPVIGLRPGGGSLRPGGSVRR